MKVVCCIWEDAVELDDGPWAERSELKPNIPTIFHQVGYLCEITADSVVLTEAVGEKYMAPRCRIPIGMVRSLVELVPGKPVRLPKQRKAR